MSKILQIGNIHPNGENQQQARVYDTKGLCPTLRAGETQGRYLIKTNSNMKEEKKVKESVQSVFPDFDRLSREQKKNLLLPEELRGKKFRIRKLTPRECFRLMGVNDADIDKIQAFPYESLIEHPAYSKDERFRGMTEKEKRAAMKRSISESAQYKLAGNSIVVDVLFHIFRKMFIEQENENQQLSLF